MLFRSLAKNFYSCEMTTDEIRFPQELFVYDRARLKRIQVAYIHNSVTLVKSRVVKSALRQSSNQRHLAAFKPEPDAPTGTRFLAFGTLPAGLSVAGTLTATKAFDAMVRAWTRPQIMKPQHVIHPFHRATKSRAT